MRWLAIAIIGGVGLGACTTPESAAGGATASITAITDVTVVPMDTARVLPGHTVLIGGEKILAVAPTGTTGIPAGAQRIDGRGLFLAPGLIDAHVHLRDSSELLGYLAHGVTTVVQLSGPTGNVTSVLDLRAQVQSGAVPGPTIHTSGPLLDGDPPIFPGVSTVVATPEAATRVVNEQAASGVDLIKVYNNLRRAPLQQVIRAAHARGMTVWGHIPRIDGRADALSQALSAGLDVIAHSEEVFFTAFYAGVDGQLDRDVVPAVTDDLIAESVRLIAANQTVVIPNLSFVAMTRAQLDNLPGVLTDPEARFLHPLVFNMWKTQNPTTRADLHRFDLRERGKQDAVQRLTLALQNAGVTLLLGTDASAPGMFPGRSAQIELQALAAAGLTPYQAMAAGTRNAGAFLGSRLPDRRSFGTITVDSRADLMLLEGNPLLDIRNAASIVGVVVRGRWYPQSEIARMRLANAHASRP